VTDEEAVDVSALVKDIEAEVARRRAAGEYPQELLARLHEQFAVAGDAEPPEALTLIESSRPLASDRLGGSLIVAGKRVMRRLLAWYVHPITQDQTRFNTAIVRELRSLEHRLGFLETRWQRRHAVPDSSTRAEAFPGDADLDPERVEVLVPILSAAPAGPTLVLGGGDDLRRRLRQRGVDVSESRDDDDDVPAHPVLLLEKMPSRWLSAIVLPAVLARLSAGELLRLVSAASAALRGGGVLVADFPDARHPLAPRDPSAVDITMQRWLAAETVELLCEAAGLTEPRRIGLGDRQGKPTWCALVLSHPQI
jgi:hypothetical protein